MVLRLAGGAHQGHAPLELTHGRGRTRIPVSRYRLVHRPKSLPWLCPVGQFRSVHLSASGSERLWKVVCVSWSSPARFSGSSILDPDRPEAHPCVPRFSGSGQRLAPGGTESGGTCEIDAEGSDVEAVMIRRRSADPANTYKVREDVQACDQLRVDVAFESMSRGSLIQHQLVFMPALDDWCVGCCAVPHPDAVSDVS